MLKFLFQKKDIHSYPLPVVFLFVSASFMILALIGPSWSHISVPTYQQIQPKVLLLDMSDEMMQTDLSPNRLVRAKFILHDLFNQVGDGQFALVVYSDEPFVVSPLTDDAKTIDALLPSLTPDIMPVKGQRLELALTEADKLIKQAGFNHGQILILTAHSPTKVAIEMANKLAEREHIYSSIIAINALDQQNPLYFEFAKAGKGQVLSLSNPTDLSKWQRREVGFKKFRYESQDALLWKDEGRWFILLALVLLLPLFCKGWLERFDT